MSARFGPAGLPNDFSGKGFKSSLEAPVYLEEMGLTAFEYQCGQGVRIREELARNLGGKTREKGIRLSLHAPYFISLSSLEEEKRANSIRYILQSARAADFMGAKRIVVHSGSCGKMSREQALELAKGTLRLAREALCAEGLSHICICPETMGKINQLGTLHEVLELCRVDESFVPCIDFGHLNARSAGAVTGAKAYEDILAEIEDALGFERLKTFHSHFSRIEYTARGGEVRHLTFSDAVYGPPFEPLMELVAQKGLSPTFICESAGTQGADAQTMMKYYETFIKIKEESV